MDRTAVPGPFWARRNQTVLGSPSAKRVPCSLPMDTGSRMCPTSRDARKSRATISSVERKGPDLTGGGTDPRGATTAQELFYLDLIATHGGAVRTSAAAFEPGGAQALFRFKQTHCAALRTVQRRPPFLTTRPVESRRLITWCSTAGRTQSEDSRRTALSRAAGRTNQGR